MTNERELVATIGRIDKKGRDIKAHVNIIIGWLSLSLIFFILILNYRF